MNRREFAVASTALLLVAKQAASAAAFPALDGPRRDATMPPARYLIVLFHGTGGDGADMFSFAPDLARYAPTAAIAAPNAATRLGDGYSWVAAGPGGRITEAESGTVDQFLSAELARYGLGPERLILIGFSQGSFIVLNLGLRRAVPPAAIVAFAGARIQPQGLVSGVRRAPVVLIQGVDDPRSSPGAQTKAVQQLADLSVSVEAHLLPELGHNIDARALKLAGEFIERIVQARP